MEYGAVINKTDLIRVQAPDEATALRMIARQCKPGEIIAMNGSEYVVNGKLSNDAVTRV